MRGHTCVLMLVFGATLIPQAVITGLRLVS